MNASLPHIMPGAEPFFFPRGPVGCLCLHGFTAAPAEIRWLGAHLAGQGLTVYGPRLSGHGTHFRDLTRMRWTDWYADALDGLHMLRGLCPQVFVVGHSMGGLLALLLASAESVAGAVVLAAPVRFRHRAIAHAHRLQYVRPYSFQGDTSDLPHIIRAEQIRRQEPEIGRVRYDVWSTAAVSQLFQLAETVTERLPQVTAPLLLVYSSADQTVPLGNQAIIAGRVKSAVVELRTLYESDHILPQDVERDTVFQLTADFITRCS